MILDTGRLGNSAAAKAELLAHDNTKQSDAVIESRDMGKSDSVKKNIEYREQLRV